MAKTKTKPVVPGARPEPPDRLREDMRAVWRETVGRMPGDWFTLETFPVLEEYCRCVCTCRDLAVWLDQVDPTSLEGEELRKHGAIEVKHHRQVVLMSTLANRLRLSLDAQRRTDGGVMRPVKGTGKTSTDRPWAANGSPSKRSAAEDEAEA